MKAYGPGLEPTGVIVNKATEFTIDACLAGKGYLTIYAQVFIVYSQERVIHIACGCTEWS